MNQHTIVLGGGIVGASVAWHVARAGNRVTIFEPAFTGRATSAGAGIVAPGTSFAKQASFYELATPAGLAYPTIVAELDEMGVGGTGYEVVGKLLLAETDEDAARLPGYVEAFTARREAGMPNIGDLGLINDAEAHAMFPLLRDVKAAMYSSGAARVDGAKMRDAMLAAARRHGAKLDPRPAVVAVEQGRAVGVRVDGIVIRGDRTVVAAGAWTNEAIAESGWQLPVSPQKGQILHMEVANHDVSRWPILDWSDSQYLLTFGPHRIVCGATREFDSGFDTRITPGGIKHVLDTQLRIVPALADAQLAEVRVGLRPYSEDGSPFIGEVPGAENLIVCTGHGPSGLLLGPYSGRLAAQLVLGQDPEQDLTDFRIDRPRPDEREVIV